MSYVIERSYDMLLSASAISSGKYGEWNELKEIIRKSFRSYSSPYVYAFKEFQNAPVVIVIKEERIDDFDKAIWFFKEAGYYQDGPSSRFVEKEEGLYGEFRIVGLYVQIMRKRDIDTVENYARMRKSFEAKVY